MKSLASLILGGLLISLTWGQQPQPSFGQPHPMPPLVREHLERLLVRAKAKCLEGAELRRQGRYAASEAAIEIAMDILRNAPFFQDIPKNELAQTYLAEGLNQLAAETWQSIYEGSGDASVPCGLAIAYARLNRAADGAKILSKYFDLCRRGVSMLDEEGLPLSSSITPAHVEATALLLWTANQTDPTRPKEMIDRLEQASKLCPHNAGIHYYLAHLKEWLLQAKWTAVELDYSEAYSYGSKRMRDILKVMFSMNNAKPPEIGIK